MLDKLLTFFTSENNFYILPFGIYQQLVHPKHDEMILLIPGFSDKKKVLRISDTVSTYTV